VIEAAPAIVRWPALSDIKTSPGQVDAQLLVAADLAGFAGHFPDLPILPGVMQIDWAVHIARQLLLLDTPVVNVERLKFTCPICPGVELRLSLRHDAEAATVDFRFYRLAPAGAATGSRSELLFSQGRLVYQQPSLSVPRQ